MVSARLGSPILECESLTGHWLVYYRTRARKINFLEEVMKAGLEEPQRIIAP
jgi:hypothetical protein